MKGVVLESLPNFSFAVDVDGKTVRAYVSGKMREHKVRVIVGDQVELVLPRQSAIGRIIKRF